LIARGEFSIAIAGIGTAGAVHPELGALAGAYVLILAVAGPVAARVIDPLVISLQARARARAQSRVPRPEEP
jgi:CPA2 family monovalent cation:H+ antiporter-2